MKITGTRIKGAIREWETKRDAASKQFLECLWQFLGEEKPTSAALADEYERAESAIAKLQVAQAEYNLAVKVSLLGNQVPLSFVVKNLGGAARLEKKWRTAALDTGADRHYGRDRSERDKNKEYASRTVSIGECMAKAKQSARVASAHREAIAKGNQLEVEIQCDPGLFD